MSENQELLKNVEAINTEITQCFVRARLAPDFFHGAMDELKTLCNQIIISKQSTALQVLEAVINTLRSSSSLHGDPSGDPDNTRLFALCHLIEGSVPHNVDHTRYCTDQKKLHVTVSSGDRFTISSAKLNEELFDVRCESGSCKARDDFSFNITKQGILEKLSIASAAGMWVAS